MLAPPPVFFKPAPNHNPLTAGLGHRFIPTAEEDEEFRLTVEDLGKKRAFNIFQDASEVSPSRTEDYLEDHRYALYTFLLRASWLNFDTDLEWQPRLKACQYTSMNLRARPAFLFPQLQYRSRFHTVPMARKMEGLNCEHTNNKLGEPRRLHLLPPTASLPRCFSIPRRLILSIITHTLGRSVAFLSILLL
jgi:hypothetical protein